jgi:hypothetical protein
VRPNKAMNSEAARAAAGGWDEGEAGGGSKFFARRGLVSIAGLPPSARDAALNQALAAATSAFKFEAAVNRREGPMATPGNWEKGIADCGFQGRRRSEAQAQRRPRPGPVVAGSR